MRRVSCRACCAIVVIVGSLSLKSSIHAQDKIDSKTKPTWESTDLKVSSSPTGDDQNVTSFSYDFALEYPDELPPQTLRVHEDLIENIKLDKVKQIVENTQSSEMQSGESAALITESCGTAPVVNTTNNSVFAPFVMCSSNDTRFTGVSNNGVIVGNYKVLGSSPARYRGFRVQSNSNGVYSNFHALRLQEQSGPVYESTWAHGISEDGNIAVGAGCPAGRCLCPSTNFDQCRLHALRWVGNASYPLRLENLNGQRPPFNDSNDARVQMEAVATSANGSVIVGAQANSGPVQGDSSNLTTKPLRWFNTLSSAATASEVRLPYIYKNASGQLCNGVTPLPSGCTEACTGSYCDGAARAVSSNGKVVAGFYRDFRAFPVQYAESFAFRSFLPLNETGLTSYRALPLPAWTNSSANPALQFILEQRRDQGLGVSPDGWAVVGRANNGLTAIDSYASSFDQGNVPLLLSPAARIENIIRPTRQDWYCSNRRTTDYNENLSLTCSSVTCPSSSISVCATATPMRMLDEATRWRLQGTSGYNFNTLGLGDLEDVNRGNLNRNFFDSKAEDSSYGGCRVVGSSFGGVPSGVSSPVTDLPVAYRTAFVRPGLRGSPGMKDLKTELTSLLEEGRPAGGRGVDRNNTSGAYWQLIDARAVTPDGTIIVGSAVCHDGDAVNFPKKIYGFVARAPTCQVPYQASVNR